MSQTRNDAITFSERTHNVSALSSAAMKPVEEKETQDEEEFGENEDPKPLQAPLAEDIYSILLVAKAWTSPLYFAVLFVLFQLLLLALIIYSLLFFTRPGNVLDLPIGANFLVVVGQGLAVILAACNAEDLLNALAFMFITVDDKLIASIPELTKTRWRVAFGLKFIEGFLCFFVIFLLIIQSTSVIGLCLNFAALSFVWDIDDTFFSLGQRGFFSKALAECTHKISNIQIPIHEKEKVHKYRNYAFYIITLLMIAPWSVVTVRQVLGKYGCDKLLVQFDDVYDPEISSLSGVYKRKSHDLLLYPIYEGEKIPNTEGSYPIIAYCRSMQLWTLTIREHGKRHSVCEWRAKSPKTRTTNILDVKKDWKVDVKETTESGAKGPLPFVHMSIRCPDDKKCDDESQYGISCQFRKPCETLLPYRASRENSVIYPDNTTESYNISYTILKEEDGELVEIKNRPVWYQKTNRNFFFLYFQGYRWNLKSYSLRKKDLSLYQNETKWPSQAREIVERGLAIEKDPPEAFRLLYSSEAMIPYSPKDKSAPVFLLWYTALDHKLDESDPSEGQLVCGGCSDYQKCRNNGKCVNGECQCKKCSNGYLCENITCAKVLADYFHT